VWNVEHAKYNSSMGTDAAFIALYHLWVFYTQFYIIILPGNDLRCLIYGCTDPYELLYIGFSSIQSDRKI
jgi:hypothetical protein